ncbi:MAG TPA: bifunctional demethylmenaquinone methyltransferase/2-methoxy-6-polyprenyl-1,4-benzoquinol methylase UbiE [Terriglobales bacterium]|nr:bifunctional demethylmenaquinone methyltransferase/2-methoxy-6-polyprenyl-1,4-benzoquinol methylase UbiE [Terriglobales bacterium]
MSQTTQPAVTGAAPKGAHDTRTAAIAVRDMFSSIAPRYDLLNHLLSFNVDRLWWRRTARAFAAVLARNDARVLDLCCGTGDMAFALRRQAAQARPMILGVDFSHPMLERAREKSAGTPLRWVEADALRLPLPDDSFDLVTAAFGFRNLADYNFGLREIARVLRPGGEAGILDFGEPRGAIGALYRFYFRRVLPKIGTVISGVKGPYQYLPASVERFPAPEEMLKRMRAADFREATWTPYTFGIAGLYRGRK